MINMVLSNFAASVGAACNPKGGSLFGFPHWYDYLPGKVDGNNVCVPALGSLNDIWRIVAAVIEILLRVGVFIAVAMVIYAGVTYAISQGESDKTAKAKNTLVDALIGLAVAVMASFIITFIAGSIS